MIAKCHNIWIVIDGLDECETCSRYTIDSVFIWIENLHSSLPNVHILITSWLEEDIKSYIKAWTGAQDIIPLQFKLVVDNIDTFIHTKVQQMTR